MKTKVFVIGKKQNKNIFLEKKNQNGLIKESSFSSSPIFSQVSRIDWCNRHWCGSTYMVVRQSDISSKTGKKCMFDVGQPHNGNASNYLFLQKVNSTLLLCLRPGYIYWILCTQCYNCQTTKPVSNIWSFDTVFHFGISLDVNKVFYYNWSFYQTYWYKIFSKCIKSGFWFRYLEHQ